MKELWDNLVSGMAYSNGWFVRFLLNGIGRSQAEIIEECYRSLGLDSVFPLKSCVYEPPQGQSNTALFALMKSIEVSISPVEPSPPMDYYLMVSDDEDYQ